MTLSVVIVDDQPEFLILAERLLTRSSDFRVVGTATSGHQALALLPSLVPDLAIVDVGMPGMNGFEVARRLLELAPALRVVIMSLATNSQYESMATQAGAAGFLAKTEFSPQAVSRILEQA